MPEMRSRKSGKNHLTNSVRPIILIYRGLYKTEILQEHGLKLVCFIGIYAAPAGKKLHKLCKINRVLHATL